MLFAAAAVLFVSAALVAGLFWLKYWEAKYDRVLAPEFRRKADEKAMKAKDIITHANFYASKMPPIAAYYSRILVHDAALGFAAIASFSESQAHRLADFVSHKHRFERRETQSDFLKQVAEHKNGIEGIR